MIGLIFQSYGQYFQVECALFYLTHACLHRALMGCSQAYKAFQPYPLNIYAHL